MKRLITAETVTTEFASGSRLIVAPFKEAIVTPEAWSKAAALGITISQSGSSTVLVRSSEAATPSRREQASCERTKDPSGLTVVRGRSVQLGTFAGAGPNNNVELADLITSNDG